MYFNRPLQLNKELVFVHTPKCGGSYVGQILNHLKIKNNGHSIAIPNNNSIYFTVIRDPVDRYESLLNFRLQCNPRNDWPKHLLYVYDTTIQLNEIVSKMTDKDILGFKPYKTLTYWTQDVDIIITLDNLPKLLEKFGYTYDTELFKEQNVSKKLRGKLSQKNRNRIKKLFREDVKLYEKVISLK